MVGHSGNIGIIGNIGHIGTNIGTIGNIGNSGPIHSHAGHGLNSADTVPPLYEPAVHDHDPYMIPPEEKKEEVHEDN